MNIDKLILSLNGYSIVDRYRDLILAVNKRGTCIVCLRTNTCLRIISKGGSNLDILLRYTIAKGV